MDLSGPGPVSPAPLTPPVPMRVVPTLLVLASLAASGCGSTGPNNRPSLSGRVAIETGALSPSATVVANAQSQPELSQLVAALQRAGLADALGGDGPFTVFAPINAAFADADLDGMGREQLAEVLRYHVVDGDVALSSLADGSVLGTLGEGNIVVTLPETNDSGVRLNDEAVVIYPDIRARNGRIHLINAVLTPQADGVSPVN